MMGAEHSSALALFRQLGQTHRPSVRETEAGDTTRLRVFETILTAGPISRVDISRRLAMSPATITGVTGAFLKDGLIEEIRIKPSKVAGRGRPPVLLQINGTCGMVAGMTVAHDAILVLITDFRGRTLGSYADRGVTVPLHADQLALKIVRAFDAACASLDIPAHAVAGLTVGCPGFVNGATGVIHSTSLMTDRNVDMKQLVERDLPCPVFFENHANLIAFAEQQFGAGRGRLNFLVVTMGEGVGMGIVIDGNLYRGNRGCSAEFGHTTVAYDGAICRCGQRGCLEAYVSDDAISRDISEGGPSAPSKTLFETINDAGVDSHQTRTVLERASRVLGCAIANLVSLFDPELIIVTRTRPPFDLIRLDILMGVLAGKVPHVDAKQADIVLRNIDEDTCAKGAVFYALQKISTGGIAGFRG